MRITEDSFQQAYGKMRDALFEGRMRLEDYTWTVKLVGGSLKLWPLREKVRIYKTLNGG